MANKDHLHRLKLGRAEWNKWRENTHERPDLSGTNLAGLNLASYNLSQADLFGTQL